MAVGEVEVRAPEGSPYGASAALQRMQRAVPAQAPAAPGPLPTPPGGPPEPGPPGAGTTADQQDLNGGYDASLFGPTDRPNESITHGAPFGSGPAFTPQPQESDRDFLMRVAGSLSQSPGASSQVKAFAAAVQAGR